MARGAQQGPLEPRNQLPGQLNLFPQKKFSASFWIHCYYRGGNVMLISSRAMVLVFSFVFSFPYASEGAVGLITFGADDYDVHMCEASD